MEKTCKNCGNKFSKPDHFDNWRWKQSVNCSMKCSIEAMRGNKYKYPRLEVIWNHMKQRCNNPNVKAFKNYGGRGIKYAKHWEKFDGFLEDMLTGYKPNLTLERIDVNGNYCKENCTWITKAEQTHNTRKTIFVEYHGSKIKLLELAKMHDMNYCTLYSRLFTYKMPVERALLKENLTGKYIRKRK